MKKLLSTLLLILTFSITKSQCNVDFTYSVNPINPLQVTFTQNSNFPPGSFAFNYTWYVFNVKVDSLNPSTTITFTAAGNYKIKFIEKACVGPGVSCTGDTAKMISVGNSTGIKQYKPKTQLVVFPNPTIGLITIKLDESDLEQKYLLIDQLGRVILIGKVKDVEEKLDLSTFSSGIYYLTIGNKVVKIMKG